MGARTAIAGLSGCNPGRLELRLGAVFCAQPPFSAPSWQAYTRTWSRAIIADEAI
jgi:hypothetical protein